MTLLLRLVVCLWYVGLCLGQSISGIKLEGGSGPYEGRVEVNINGVWGTICHNNFDMNDAKVLCRMMNLSATAYFPGAYYGQGIGPIFADNLGCSGHETHLEKCSFNPNVACQHSQDVSLICTKCSELEDNFAKPSSVSSDGNTLYVTCDLPHEDEPPSFRCELNGTWTAAGTQCPTFGVDDIRLANKRGLYDGRVEIMMNGIWGTICGLSFSSAEATVICNMFGLGYETHFNYYYGGGSGPVHIDQLKCYGNESHLDNCTYSRRTTCSHYYDIAVVCKNSSMNFTGIRLTDGSSSNRGRVQLEASGVWGTICNWNMQQKAGLETICHMLGLNFTLAYSFSPQMSVPAWFYGLDCNNGDVNINTCSYFVAHQMYCTSTTTDLGLLCTGCGVPDVSNGYVLTSSSYHNSTTTTIQCNSGYIPNRITATCLENGTWVPDTTCTRPKCGTPSIANAVIQSIDYINATAKCNSGYKPAFIVLRCLENGTWQADEPCTKIDFPLNITHVRLTYGTYYGRFEILVNGVWGTICSDEGFGVEEAEVLCRMLGLNYKDYRRASQAWISNMIISNLNCYGNESHINDCSYNIQHNCRDNSYTYVPWIYCAAEQHNITNVRLAGANGPYNGRVEIEVNNTWGTICDNGFDSTSGATVCSMLDLKYHSALYNANYGQGTGPVYIEYLVCTGDQRPAKKHINECSYMANSTCSHQDDISVICYGPSLNITDIRLVNGTGPFDGRAEIKIDDVWGTICGKNFHSTYDADTICRTLGLRVARSSVGLTQGTGPIHIDELVCSSSYPHLNQCQYLFLNTCTHALDVSVVCYGSPLNITSVRLANGTGPYDGRAEMQVNGVWGTICDREFDFNDANLFCKILGLKAAHYLTGAINGEGTGPIHVDEFHCTSTTANLNQCQYLFLNSCTHARDVSVVCNECGRPVNYYWDVGYFSYNGTTLYADCAYYKTYVGTLQMTCDNITKTWKTEGVCQEYKFPLDVMEIRLVGGNSKSYGRVELKSLNRWGTVCDHSFGINEANAICAMIGYWPATAFYKGAHFGEGSGPIFVDDLKCSTDAKHINNCTYVTYDNCQHSNDVSVECNDCGDPTPQNGSAKYNGTYFGAVAELSCDEGYRLIGHSVITCELNHTWSTKSYCKFIDCEDPTPEHGSANSSLTTNGSVVAISCNEGYNISGNGIITCMENDMWSDTPTCRIIDCGYPEPANAEVQLSTNETTYKAKAVVNCVTGYDPDGSWTLSCLANGSWEAWPQCTIKDCGDPTPFKGSVNDTATVYGTVIEVTCDDGYNITGESVIICQQDGTWSDTPRCSSSDCGRPSVPNGVAELDNGTTSVGSVAYISCNLGYNLVGPSSIICTIDGWNDTVACVKQDCGDPMPLNGHAAFDGTKFGDRATITCNTGYVLDGDTVITCQAGGIWSDRPTCTLVDCGIPQTPANGIIDTSNGTVYNSTVTFTCNKGYVLVGASITVCLRDGKWSDKSPTCAKTETIGESCISVEYCKTEGAVCINNVCRCTTGIHDHTADKCNIMPMFSYGISAKDIHYTGEDLCSDKITFSPGIPVNGKHHKDLYVCVNGLISFDDKYTNPVPPKDRDSVSTDLGERIILAPFYAQINTSSGSLFYRTYDILHSFPNMQTDKNTIDYIVRLAKQFGNVDNFEASFVLIATWEKLTTSQPDYDNTRHSTFQLVLISDGKVTMVMYIYGHEQMLWQKAVHSPTHVFVGHSTGKHFLHPFSYSQVVLSMDKAKTTDPLSRDDVSGLVFQTISKAEEAKPNYAVECIKWYNRNWPEKFSNDIVNSRLPKCPCDIWLSRFDPWFWQVDRSALYRYTCVDMVPGIIYKPYGKSCCYNNTFWVDQRPHAGGFYRYHPLNDIKNHHLHDIDPKRTCCELSNYCKLYYDLRPTGACYGTSPYNFGMFWGDPHFRTLDGLNFTFNGLGEYTLLRIKNANVSFELQTRTARAVKADGSLSDATIFSAFAAMDHSNASFHAELNRAKTGLNVYVNGRDITTQYYANYLEKAYTYKPEENNIDISKRGDALHVFFQATGVALNVSVSSQMLSLSTIVPDTYRNTTNGLLGNFNNKPSDDFTLPNGTILSANMTEREIFSYGQLWSINPNMSAFIYEDGKSHEDFHNASYVPRFLDEVDPEKLKEAEKICNGSQNIECVFDYVFTEKIEVAEDANRLRQQAESTQEELDVTLPELQGCATVNATNSSLVTCKLSMDDDYDVRFMENTIGAVYNSSTKVISFMQATADPVLISVAAVNHQGRSSLPFVVSVLLCTGCSGNGICTNTIRDDPRETEYYKYLACQCFPQYEGLDCEHVFNGCRANPCSLGRNCTSLSANEQLQQNRTYKCGPCPVGYQSKDDYNVTCHDIDECSAQTVNCDHNCSNTVGSYQCSCLSGYRADSRNPHKCRDINECDEGVHTCTQLCVNHDGGYNCSCHDGYSFDETSWSCHLKQDSSCSDNRTCLNTDGCIRQNNSDVCICNSGSELNDTLNNHTCKDINECERNACPQLCNNINGGFICSCFDGYRLEDKTACTECTVPYWGFNCSKRCECSGRGALRCDPVKGCVCSDGWSGGNCNNDIDECARDPNICKDPRKECINTEGSFTCRCRKGYYENNSICEDLNECSNPLLNDCEQQCTNVIGGYSCSCLNGFKRYNNTSCEDIDECKLGTDGCSQVCKNNPGLYSCYCHFGYTLNDDRKTCTKLSDPCKTINKLDCSHFCYVSGNQASCRCQKGYQLATDNQTCIDINECQNGTLNLCDKRATCSNTAGSFQCKCPSGTRLENDGRTCSDCDAFHFGENCLQNCSCLNGRCEKTIGCVCDQGWNGNRCDIDIDECKSGQLKCTTINSECKNTPGSAICSCLQGYHNVSGYCEDIDECSKVDWNTCDHQCVNLPGKYKCVCQPGFLFTDVKCSDIDECSLKIDGCEQVCDNTIGSYRCSCEAGFRLDLTDRRSCLAENECSVQEKNKCEPNATCFLDKGNATCRCKRGFKNDSGDCIDIDECLLEQSLCEQKCNNTIGSFMCGCQIGYVLQEDTFSCKECDSWNYGINCTYSCICSIANTEYCNHTTGHCQCKGGWSGPNCSIDIDECKTNTADCPQHSRCRNTDGGYECVCDRGYIKTGSGECHACSNHKYGDSCQTDCQCDRDKSETCHHVTGDCTCLKGWTGEHCTLDVEECADITICETKQNSTCMNTIGSYTCSCKPGFTEEANICKDLDECLTAGHDCIQQCVNTVGGYDCKCRPGFHGSHNNCTACNSNQYGENCTGRCSCIIANSADKTQTCNRETGKCECSPNWTGDTCSQDVDECLNQNNCPDNENKGCRNTDGWYKCECYRGFIELDDGTCAIDKESSAKLDLTLKIKGVDLTEQQIKEGYDKLKQDLEHSLERLYRKYSKDPLHIRINDIKKGSLVVSYSVVYDKADTSLASAIAKALIDQGKGISSLSFNGTTFSITAEDYKDLEPCEIYQQTFGVCKKDLECLVENETPVCRPKSNDSSLPLIIGLSVGGFVLLVIITVITCCLWKRSHQDSHRGQFNNESSEYADIGKGQSNYSDYSSIGQWLRRVGTSEDGKYLTWKSMLSRSSRSENVYDSSFQIPRARTGMSPFAAGGSTSSVQDGM